MITADIHNAKAFSWIARYGEPMINKTPAMEGPRMNPLELMKFRSALNLYLSFLSISFVIYTIDVGPKMELAILMIKTHT